MANEDHLKILDQGVEAWNLWRQENRRETPDLSHPRCSLPLELEGINLCGADLSNADLSDGRLIRADLSKAILRNADLCATSFIEANLYHADLTGAYMTMANLSHADLRGANLSGANLRSVETEELGTVNVSLHNANLSGVDFSRANLSGINLNGRDLRRTNLRQATLCNANLHGANLSGLELFDTDLSNARLEDTTLADVDLSATVGLDSCRHGGPSILDHRTLQKSGPLPVPFLRGCGMPDTWIEFLHSRVGTPLEFYSCFISYSHEDKIFAQQLHDHLQGKGIRCWLDVHQMLPGDDIYESVDRGIRLWDKILLCASKNSLSSWWVDDEVDKAFAKERELTKQRGQTARALIPLNLDGHLFRDKYEKGYKTTLMRRLAANFEGWEDDNAKLQKGFDQIVQALRADEGAREKPPEPKL